MVIISTVSPKGGVGKTLLSCNIGAGVAREGKRTLMVDMDRAAFLTYFFLGWDPHEAPCIEGQQQYTVADIIQDPSLTQSAIQTVVLPANDDLGIASATIDVIPCNLSLDAALANTTRIDLLRLALEPIEDQYDVVLIDTMPFIARPTVDAIHASNFVIIPLVPNPHFHALIRHNLDVVGLEKLWMLPNFILHGDEESLILLQDLRDSYPQNMLPPIPQRAIIREAYEKHIDIYAYCKSKDRDVVEAFQTLVEDVIKRTRI